MMAAKNKNIKPASKNQNKDKILGRTLGTNERWVYGFILLFLSLFILLSVVSYYFTWSDDQSLIREEIKWSEIDKVSNSAGKMGAFVGATLVGKWFGALAICIPIVFIILSLRIVRIRPLFLNRAGRITFITMILGSVTLGYLFSTKWGIFGSGLGGETGIAVSVFLSSLLGNIGLGLLLLMCWVLLAVYVNRNTISIVNRMGRAVSRSANDLIDKIAPVSKPEPDTDKAAAVNVSTPTTTPNPVTAAAQTNGGKNVIARDDDPGDFRVVPTPPPADERKEDSGRGIIRSGGIEIEITRPGEEEDERDGARGWRESDSVSSHEKTNNKPDSDTDEDIVELVDTTATSDDDIIVVGDMPDSGVVVGENIILATETEGEDEDFIVINSDGERVPASTLRDSRKPSPAAQTNAGVQIPATGSIISAGGIVESGNDGITIIQNEYRDEEADDEELLAKLYDPTLELKDYQRPPVEILEDHSVGIRISDEEIRRNQEIVREKLADFGIGINDRIKATIGPTVTLYEIEPAQGVKISRIRNLEEDIALALKVQSIRIVTLGAGRGTVGIEVPNSTREVVSMYSLVKSVKFQDNKYKLPIVLGKTIYNEIYIGDLTKMPHLLIAGATGQGKSVGLNAIITSLLYKKHPAELKFVMVDPKQVELSVYSKLEKHFLAKMESEDNPILTDVPKVVYTLNSLVNVMEERYTLLNKAGERNIADYNQKFLNRRLNPNKGHHFMPYIVVVIDEFADMIMTAGKEVEIPITRLAAKARAVGIHLIVATQRPDVKVITGLIKSNIPARIAFKVVSMVDSRTIIDQPGANNLIGMGDMLMSIGGELTRIQCAFIDTPEIERMSSFISRQKGYPEAHLLPDYTPPEVIGSGSSKEDVGRIDDMFAEVARWVVESQEGSTSAIQRNFELGYNRAGRITDQLHKAGIVGPRNGSKPREVLVYDTHTLERILQDLEVF